MIPIANQRVVITGVGCWTGLGEFNRSWERLLAKQTSIQLQQPFSELPPLPLSLIGEKPIFLSELTGKVVRAALADAKLTPPLPSCGVVVGSSRGGQGEIEKWARKETRTQPWLNILPQQSAIAAAQIVGSTDRVLSPMAACSTGLWSIAQGYDLIKEGRCQQVIAGAVEAPITPLTLTGFLKMGALAKTGCYPFDEQREGLVLGEGGAVMVLEGLDSAKARKALIYAEIGGYGLTCDAYQISAPNPDSHRGMLAVKKALAQSSLSVTDINHIHAHGTSTKLNDEREARLIQSLFSSDVAVTSSKGATGHSLGASGAIAIAFTLKALQAQTLPPCVGLNHSPFALNLVQASMKSRINHALVLSFGFGGQNGSMILKRILESPNP